MTELSVVSYGGGVQSTALLVLAAQRKIEKRVFLFANVGDDSENPSTLRYLSEVALPFAERHGIDLHVLSRTKRDGQVETLWGRLMRPGSRSLPIPVRMSNGAPGRRSCTTDFKIRVIGKWLKTHGATVDDPASVAIGISVDEIHRANSRRADPHESIVYPLLDLGHRRSDCVRIIAGAGLPVPPKSACFFCPFRRPSAWQDMARDEAALFAKACLLEDTLNRRRDRLGKDHVFLTRFGMPLRKAINTNQELLPLVDETGGVCDSGWCWL
ncbi:MAG: hypothetical protein LBI99_08990 [Propionibacteriaceae bacterium]|jgi:PP-loop superfamily ATP-utilizing enzyme|nr:hypothetical protein [Propionibacteriaceae bacterium]